MYTFKKKKGSLSFKKTLLIVASLFAVAILAVGILQLSGAIHLFGTSEDQKQTTIKKIVSNVNGQIDSKNNDDAAAKPSPSPKTDTDSKNSPLSKKTVSATLTQYGNYGDQISAAGYVSGIFEDGGSCNYIFKGPSQTITRTASSVSDASNTSCPQVNIDKSQFVDGDWVVTLSYSSATSNGTSSPEKFHVQ